MDNEEAEQPSGYFIRLMNAVLLILIPHLFPFCVDDADICQHKNHSGLVFALFCPREGGLLTILCRSKEAVGDKVEIVFGFAAAKKIQLQKCYLLSLESNMFHITIVYLTTIVLEYLILNENFSGGKSTK